MGNHTHTTLGPRPAALGAVVLATMFLLATPVAAQDLGGGLTGPAATPATFVPVSLGALSFDPAGTTSPAITDLGLAAADTGVDQNGEPAKPSRNVATALYHNLIDDIRHLPRRNSLYFLAGGGALALAVHPYDRSINAHFEGSGAIGAFYTPGKYIGATEVQIGTAAVVYVIGRWQNKPRVQHMAMDMLEAQILAEGIIELTKEAVRRPRPTNPDGTPTTSGYSFPSGHAAVTFATATVFQEHFGWSWAIPTYILATYVATSRLHDNVHFASDVVMGSAAGIIIGRSVTWHGRNDFRIGMVAIPGGLGTRITF